MSCGHRIIAVNLDYFDRQKQGDWFIEPANQQAFELIVTDLFLGATR